MIIRRFMLLSKQDIESIQLSLDPVISKWAETWLSGTAVISISSRAVSYATLERLEESIVYKTTDGTDQSCVVSMNSSVLPGLLSYVVPIVVPDDSIQQSKLLNSVEAELWGDLAQHLIGSSAEAAEKAFLSRYVRENGYNIGSPFVELKVSIGGFYFFIYLPKTIDGQDSDVAVCTDLLEQRMNSLRHQRFSLDVTLAKTELTVNELSQIREGDVIRLDHQLSDPLYLHTENSTTVLQGFLCRNQEDLNIKVDSVVELNTGIRGNK